MSWSVNPVSGTKVQCFRTGRYCPEIADERPLTSITTIEP
jgi:hypothetical protein